MSDDRFERAILDLLSERRSGASICPSEAARRVGGGDERAWRPLMESVREAARRMSSEGRLEVTQRGEVVDPATTTGPIRLRLKR